MTLPAGIRRARDADNRELLELFESVPMNGGMALRSLRGPDFFALPRLQKGTFETWVYQDPSRIQAMGTLGVREAWLGGAPTRVGYLGDLRSRFGRARGMAKGFGPLLEDFAKKQRCEVFLSAVLAGNQAALAALVSRRSERIQQPHYQLLRRFDAVSVLVRSRRSRRERNPVRPAAQADLSTIRRLLSDDHRRRVFGYRFDAGELEHRLAHWPGYTLERLFVLEEGTELVGCAAVWDPFDVKRYQVEAYPPALRWARLPYNLVALASGLPPLPKPGRPLRYAYLCNPALARQDPVLLRRLIDGILERLAGSGTRFLSLYLEEGDPLASAVAGRLAIRLHFHLYAVTPASRGPLAPIAGRTGFEIALA